MKKLFILIFTLSILVTINAVTQYTPKDSTPSEIIDTVYAEVALHGYIELLVELNLVSGGACPPSENMCHVGDDYCFDYDSNVSIRSYFSFVIDTPAAGYAIDRVTFYINQRVCFGNSFEGFPIWDDREQLDCMLARVDYGNTLEASDFYPAEVSEIGAISTHDNFSNGLKQLDVTNAYRQDKSAGRVYFQTMLYFPLLSDMDFSLDEIIFDNPLTPYPSIAPRLVIRYVNTTANEDNYNSTVPTLTVYPNPIFNTATVQAKTGANLLSLEVYNAKGQRIEGISRHEISKSEQVLTFDRSKLPAGLYFIRSAISEQGRTYTTSRKVMLY